MYRISFILFVLRTLNITKIAFVIKYGIILIINKKIIVGRLL